MQFRRRCQTIELVDKVHAADMAWLSITIQLPPTHVNCSSCKPAVCMLPVDVQLQRS